MKASYPTAGLLVGIVTFMLTDASTSSQSPNEPHSLRIGSVMGGASTTALDMATFGQMFLNRGTYSGVQVLSSMTAAEMTSNQDGSLHSPSALHLSGPGGVYLWVGPLTKSPECTSQC